MRSATVAFPTPDALGFALTFVDGAGVLRAEGLDLPPFGRIDRLDMEVPGLRFPADVSGEQRRFASKRCRLRDVVFSFGAAEAVAVMRALPLPHFGLLDADAQVHEGRLHVCARAVFGKREALVSAVADLVPSPPRQLQLSFVDVRVHGFLPIPAPLVPMALFTAMGARVARGLEQRDAPWSGLSLLGATDLQIDVLEIALLELLAGQGWRLPERGHLALVPPSGSERIVVGFAGVDAGGEGHPRPRTQIAAHDEARARNAVGEGALLRGDVAAARDHYRRAVALDDGDGNAFAATRLLQILVAASATLGEADELATKLLARTPEFVPALLARATVAGEQSRWADAAAIFERVAGAASGGWETDRLIALLSGVSAARQAGQGERARGLMERVWTGFNDRPPRAVTLTIFRTLCTELEHAARWTDLLQWVRQRAADEPCAGEKARLCARAGFVQLERMGDPIRARDRFDEAVHLDETEPSGWEGRGRALLDAGTDRAEAARALERARTLYAARDDRAGGSRVLRALAAMDRELGQTDAAIERLRKAADLDQQAWQPLHEASELLLRGGNALEAANLLLAAGARATDSETRSMLWRRLAGLRARELGDVAGARALLEQVLRDNPVDVAALDDLASVLAERRDLADLETFLRRALGLATDPALRRLLLDRLRDLGRRLGNEWIVADALAGAGMEGGMEGSRAAIELADLAVAGDDSSRVAQAAEVIEALLTVPAPVGFTPPHAELSLRLALLRDRQGREDAALVWLRACLEGDAPEAAAVAAWRRFVEIAARRGDARATAQALVAWADDGRTGESEGRRAAHLVAAAEIFRERLNLPEDAATLLERAVSLDPASASAFDALEALVRQGAEWPRLVEVLERRAAAARQGEARPVRSRLAEALFRAGRSPEATDVYRRLAETAPQDLDAAFALARHLWRAGQHQEATLWFGKFVGAADGFQNSVARDAERGEAHLRLAQWARVAGHVQDAASNIAAGVSAEPRGASLDVLVEVLEDAGRNLELVDILRRRKANAAGADVGLVARALGGVLERGGRSSEAEVIYRDLLQVSPNDADLWFRLVEIFRREGRPAALCACLERLWGLAEAFPSGGHAGTIVDLETVGLELAALVAEDHAERAEAILRRLAELRPESTEAVAALGSLVAGVRARHAPCGGGLATADLLRLTPIEEASSDVLALRAKNAEELGDDAEALACLRQMRRLAEQVGDHGAAIEIGRSMATLARQDDVDPLLGIAIFEAALAADPADQDAADALMDLYGRLPDIRARNRAWMSLASRAQSLDDRHRGRIQFAQAEMAFEDGDLRAAEEAFRRALAAPSDPATRVLQLLGHARTLLGLGDSGEASADLEEVLMLDPESVGALLMVGDLAYRALDWDLARSTYDRLSRVPAAGQVIDAVTLALRRAELAEKFGDEVAAASAYHEVLAADPAHVEAREALAGIAMLHERWDEAAAHLESLLRVHSVATVSRVGAARRHLGQIRARLGQCEAAREHLEVALAVDKDDVNAMESLLGVYVALHDSRQAAALAGKLARAQTDPARKARTLFQQAEILRMDLGDEPAATDAYLRSSDADPTFVPTLLRLCHVYWRAGDFANVADVGRDIAAQGPDAFGGDHEDAALLVALCAAGVRRDEGLAAKAYAAAKPESSAERIAKWMGDLTQRLDPQRADVVGRAWDFLAAVAPTDAAAARKSLRGRT